MFKKILVAVDGSEQSIKAANTAGDLARSMEADLIVVTTYEPIHSYKGQPYIQKEISERMEWAEKAQKEALKSIGKIPGELTQEILEGPAAEAILKVVDARGVDLVVMGTRGLGGLKGTLLGSQSQKVIRHAPCAVMVVK
jgi:nucleotide-binding universal stress UspA family protein